MYIYKIYTMYIFNLENFLWCVAMQYHTSHIDKILKMWKFSCYGVVCTVCNKHSHLTAKLAPGKGELQLLFNLKFKLNASMESKNILYSGKTVSIS